MVYQIYYQTNGNSNRQVMFDIEVYIKENGRHASDEDKWYVEMHSTSFISGAVDFIVNTSVGNIAKGMLGCPKESRLDLTEFASDCGELEELRGWLWETHSNKPRTMEEASKDKSEWTDYVKAKVYGFAEKYGLFVNED